MISANHPVFSLVGPEMKFTVKQPEVLVMLDSIANNDNDGFVELLKAPKRGEFVSGPS